MSHLTAVAVMILASAMLGACFPAVQYALKAGFDVTAFLGFRFVLGAIALGITVSVFRARFTARAVLDGAMLGLLISAAYWFQADGLKFIMSSQSAFISGLALIFTPFFSLFLGQQVLPRHGLAAALSLIGLYLLVAAAEDAWAMVNRGTWETLISAAIFGLQIVMTGRFCLRSDPLVLSLVQTATAAVLFMVIVYVLPSGVVAPDLAFLLQPGILASLFFTGFLAAAFTFWAQCTMQKRLSATEVAILFSLEPVFATAIAVTGMVPGIDERLLPAQWAGAGLLLLAALFAELGFGIFSARSRLRRSRKFDTSRST